MILGSITNEITKDYIKNQKNIRDLCDKNILSHKKNFSLINRNYNFSSGWLKKLEKKLFKK